MQNPQLSGLLYQGFFSCEILSGSLCPRDVERIRNWSIEYDIGQHDKLTQTGKEELEGIGMRIREKFPSVFKDPHPEQFRV